MHYWSTCECIFSQHVILCCLSAFPWFTFWKFSGFYYLFSFSKRSNKRLTNDLSSGTCWTIETLCILWEKQCYNFQQEEVRSVLNMQSKQILCRLRFFYLTSFVKWSLFLCQNTWTTPIYTYTGVSLWTKTFTTTPTLNNMNNHFLDLH